jgi:hypothetical protein
MEGFKNLRDSKEGMLEEINELTNQLVQWTENQNNAGNARKYSQQIFVCKNRHQRHDFPFLLPLSLFKIASIYAMVRLSPLG